MILADLTTENDLTDPLTSAPILETERLTLRGPIKDDLSAYTGFMTNSARMRSQGETVSAEQAWFGFLTGIGHWQWHGFGFFTLTERGQQHPLGRVGLLRHSNWPDTELAWHLFDSAEGMMRFRQIATETAGFYNTVGFNDDTRAFCSIPARHDVARRVDAAYLAKLVATGRLREAEAHDLMHELTYRLAKKAYRL